MNHCNHADEALVTKGCLVCDAIEQRDVALADLASEREEWAEANHSLKAALDEARAEVERLRAELAESEKQLRELVAASLDFIGRMGPKP